MSIESKMRSLELLLVPQIGAVSTSSFSSSSTAARVANHRSDPHLTRIEDAFEGLEQLLCLLDTMQVDGSVLKKTGVVQTLTRLKRDERFLRCRDATSTLIKKWCDLVQLLPVIFTIYLIYTYILQLLFMTCYNRKEQVVADNQYSTLKSFQGGNIVAVPDSDSSIACPSSVPPRLWRRLCESYNNSQLFAIQYVCNKLDDSQDTRTVLVQGPVSYLTYLPYLPYLLLSIFYTQLV